MACAVLALAGAGAAWARNDAPPEGLQRPLADGCQRTAVGLLTNTSAHWVYVYGDSTPRPAQGVALEPHPGAGDLPQAHDWYDQNFDLRLDPSYRYLGGLPATQTVHVERESGKLPVFAWATDQDAIRLWGSWVWDCGHWGTQNPAEKDFLLPGQSVPGDTSKDLTDGESTEIHPYRAVVVTRSNPYLPSVGETQADVVISSDGTRAHAEQQCAASHRPPGALPSYGPDFAACVASPVPITPGDPTSYPAVEHDPVNDQDYTFFVPAPPRPSPGAQLRYRVVTGPGHGAAPGEFVDVRSDGIQVTIPFRGFGDGTQPQAYAKTFFVGWDGDVQRIPARLEVTLKKLTVANALDTPRPGETSSGVPPGEYGMYLDVNGDWTYLNDLAPGLGAVLDGTAFDLNRTIGVNVADGGRVRLSMATRECDLPKINPCPRTPEVADDNDVPGDTEAVFPSVASAVGDHVLKGGPAGAPNWTLTYNVRLISPATTSSAASAPPPGGLEGTAPPSAYPNAGPAGSAGNLVGQAPPAAARRCVDTFAPSSRFSRARIATRRRLVLRGRASDRTCGGARGRVRGVSVAVVRRTRSTCRFLQASGRLGPVTSCRRPLHFLARGTTQWRFARRVRLPPGHYAAWTRSVDSAGNVGYPGRLGTIVRFRIR